MTQPALDSRCRRTRLSGGAGSIGRKVMRFPSSDAYRVIGFGQSDRFQKSTHAAEILFLNLI